MNTKHKFVVYFNDTVEDFPYEQNTIVEAISAEEAKIEFLARLPVRHRIKITEILPYPYTSNEDDN